ncbi:aldehyde dehydrogenase [Burkholderia sp. SCN-KJ]|uniref:aldehyde dehydrogenase family protein n=1 Tax=Burkholderia sp. SCN-KJ TaxID=2969248 RepID=UPI00214F7EBF|nr:aldehyde dehydrogenase family protein [Burkholderia sp. SCN-KJ]MCR4470466.1 aldehyde dehydrogenase family protein [Burkholderia sp. SCN-KJ]
MNRLTLEQELKAAGTYGHFINGDFPAPRGEKAHVTLNPANGTPLARFAAATDAEVDAAVAAARHAFQVVWGRTTGRERHEYMRRLASELERRAERLAWLETLDVGKPIGVSRAAMRDLPYTVDYYASVLHGLTGETLQVAERDVLNFTLREPLGVCALIVPWNYPLTLALLKIAPAIAAGNTVVLKPSEVTPLSALELGRAVADAGLPAGVVNIVFGDGTTGNALIHHPGIDKISFTGGTDTGKRIYAAAAAGLKRVTLELGGKSPLVVFDDADLPAAIEVAKVDSIRNSGQVCAACTRLIVHEGVADAFVDGLTQALSAVRIGDPGNDETEMGPVINAAQLERIQGYREVGLEEGARFTTCQDIATRADLKDGYYAPPALFLQASNEMRVSREEIFGPVQTVLCFRTEEQGLRLANDSPYGLAACVFTRDSARAIRTARATQAGTVCINYGVKAVVEAPFGGYKQSGIGKERGLQAMLDDTQLKSVRLFHG